MKNRLFLASAVLLLLLLLLISISACQPSVAPSEASATAAPSVASEPPPKATPTGAPRSAVFAVPGLQEEGVQKFVNALAGVEGVLSAKPDLTSGEFVVSFEDGRVDSGKLLEHLRSVDSGITLRSDQEGPALEVPPAHDCGGCPFRNSCNGEL